MTPYIDGFIFPILREHITEYQDIAKQVAEIWKEHGALSYSEFVGGDMHLQGTRSFLEAAAVKTDEVVVFGWVTFPSKAVRDKANELVLTDPRMQELVTPLMNPDRMIFDASRMIYGGFEQLVEVT